MNTVWKAVLAAALTGAATAALEAMTGGGDRIYEHALIGAAVGVAAYLKQSPIPPPSRGGE